MGRMRNAYKFWLENLKGRDHLEELRVDGRIILECMLESSLGGCELDSSGSG
jgi:hypothetical protein